LFAAARAKAAALGANAIIAVRIQFGAVSEEFGERDHLTGNAIYYEM
jgi:uncharacterized protein YbjQ (UPF0145 family)